jgi:hypothetical protein
MRIRVIFLFSLLLVFSCHFYGQDFIQVSGNSGCPPDTVTLSINPDSASMIDFTFWVNYTITGGNLDTMVSTPTGTTDFVFEESGNFIIELSSAGNPGAVITRRSITVRQILKDQFERQVVTAPLEYNFVPVDTITDTLSSYSFIWTIYENGTYMDESLVLYADYNSLENASFQYAFPDTGTYEVRLQSQRNIASCASEKVDTLLVVPALDTSSPGDSSIIQVANYFAPATSEYYIIDPQDPSVILSFKLFSRTGVLVFSTESPIIYWDGRNSYGQELSSGVYYYVLEAVQGSIGNTDPKGFIHLFR